MPFDKNFLSDNDGWDFIQNEKIHLKQNQLFYANRLMLKIRHLHKQRMTYNTPEELFALCDFASKSEHKEVRVLFNQLAESLNPGLKELFCKTESATAN